MRGSAIRCVRSQCLTSVNGRGPFRTPTAPKPLNRFDVMSTPQGVDIQNLVGIYSAVTDLPMCKNTFCVDFFININVKKLNSLNMVLEAKSHV